MKWLFLSTRARRWAGVLALWLALLGAGTPVQIAAVTPFPDDSGATVTTADGATYRVFGAVPHTGAASVEFTDCWLWVYCAGANIYQDGLTYKAVR